LRELAPELIVVVAYGKILPPEILSLPPLGCVNIHASLLPKYRGAAPIQWALLNGETESGVSAMQMDAGLDTGAVLLQKKIAVPPEMNAGELFGELSALGAETLTETLARRGELVPVPQDDASASFAPPLSKAMSPLDFSRPARELHNQVRGLAPWPGASTEFAGRKLKVWQSRVADSPLHALCLPCGDGKFLELRVVQAEGKRALPAEEFLRGVR